MDSRWNVPILKFNQAGDLLKRDCTMRRRDVLALGLSSLSVAASRSLPASAQGKYPGRSRSRLVVPRSAGGVVDVVGPLLGRTGQGRSSAMS